MANENIEFLMTLPNRESSAIKGITQGYHFNGDSKLKEINVGYFSFRQRRASNKISNLPHVVHTNLVGSIKDI